MGQQRRLGRSAERLGGYLVGISALSWLVALLIAPIADASVEALLSLVGQATAWPGLVACWLTRRYRIAVGSAQEPLRLSAPFVGEWVAVNSPDKKIPSHGTTYGAQTFAYDFVDSADRNGHRAGLRTSTRRRRPEEYASFGSPILAPTAGTVVAAVNGHRDHRGWDGWMAFPSAFAGGTARQFLGWRYLAGNHVVIKGKHSANPCGS